jgi:hypothetical protein
MGLTSSGRVTINCKLQAEHHPVQSSERRPEPATGGEVLWLEPYPDRLLDELPLIQVGGILEAEADFHRDLDVGDFAVTDGVVDALARGTDDLIDDVGAVCLGDSSIRSAGWCG